MPEKITQNYSKLVVKIPAIIPAIFGIWPGPGPGLSLISRGRGRDGNLTGAGIKSPIPALTGAGIPVDHCAQCRVKLGPF